MADPNPLAAMPLAESLASNMNESLQWMSRLWGGSAPSALGTPAGLPSMMVPTLDPKELERRIADLRTVEHWLDMNRALLHSTIQTLEMQRNGLVALQSMARAAPSAFGGADARATPATFAEPVASPRGDAAAAAAPMSFDPTPWWNALQEQFARVAATAASGAQRSPEEPSQLAAPPQSDAPKA
jgi:hypothetical protein